MTRPQDWLRDHGQPRGRQNNYPKHVPKNKDQYNTYHKDVQVPNEYRVDLTYNDPIHSGARKINHQKRGMARLKVIHEKGQDLK